MIFDKYLDTHVCKLISETAQDRDIVSLVAMKDKEYLICALLTVLYPMTLCDR